MAKKAKGNAKSKASKKEKQPDIPAEWVGKSTEELEALVAGLESQLTDATQRRNKSQAEHASIQSYYDVTREQIRELDMQIEKKNLEIENAEEDNATELCVYEQKAKFIRYCHENRLKEASDNNEQKMSESSSEHDVHIQSIEAAKVDMKNALIETEGQQANEISKLQQDGKVDHMRMKESLDADVKLFKQQCDDQHAELQRELESRRETALKIVDSRKESHLNDLQESHQHRCTDMRTYFEGIERQQEIDIEDLEAEIRRLKKAAIHREENSNQLKESNEQCGEELKIFSGKVVILETKTKDKAKNATSLGSTNARLSATRKAIREATVKHKQLQEKFGVVEEERNCLVAAEAICLKS